MGRVPRWRMGKWVYHVFNRGINSRQDDEERDIFTEGGKCLGDEDFKSNLQLVSGRLTSRKKGRRKTQ